MNILNEKIIEEMAFSGMKNHFCLRMGNPNLFTMIFKWEQSGEYRRKLKYTSLYSPQKNYAPYISFECKESFYHRCSGYKIMPENAPSFLSGIHLDMGLLGNVMIPLPKRCLVTILPLYSFMLSDEPFQISDNTYLLEIDYSPEMANKAEENFQNLLQKEFEERKKQELEEMKKKILKKEKNKQLKEAAIRELQKEGKI